MARILLVVAALMVFFGCASTEQLTTINNRLDGMQSRLDDMDGRISSLEKQQQMMSDRQDYLEGQQSGPTEVGRSMQMDDMDEALQKAEAAAKRAEAAAEKAERVYKMRLRK